MKRGLLTINWEAETGRIKAGLTRSSPSPSSVSALWCLRCDLAFFIFSSESWRCDDGGEGVGRAGVAG